MSFPFNFVGYPAQIAQEQLEKQGLSCSLVITQPPLGRGKLIEDDWYVLRQRVTDSNLCELIVAARIYPSYM